ncbi:MAG: RHS repeat protein [Bdellovibrionaceae bacterium]|nr:RHS repeat protein [Pseudobdellovibrionaceae bacterium]
MKRLLGLVLVILTSIQAQALVDMKNANYSDTWTDLIAPGTGYDLRVQRTYNSRTLFNGIFGFGWCSDFETKLEITAEGSIKVTECGGGLEISYKPADFSNKEIANTIEKIAKEVKKRNPSLTDKFMSGLKEELKSRPFFREELTRQLGFTGKVSQGKTYFAQGRQDESIVFKKGVYIRSLPDNTSQQYNDKGQLISLYDKNGNYLKLTYKGELLVKVSDNAGRSLDFQFDPVVKKVKAVTGPGGIVVKYQYKGEDLIEANNAWKDTYTYVYDDVHNLTKVAFPDKTTKEIRYDKDKDWVTSFLDRKKCEEKYTYSENPKDPLNHYWSIVEKKCKGKVTNQSKYEFWHKFSKDGKRYLYRAYSKINNSVTDITYHSKFGKPIYINRNNIRVKYSYYKSGMISKKIEPAKTTSYSYKGSCGKVVKVSTQYFGFEKPKKVNMEPTKKLIKTVMTNFSYQSPKCNLIAAKNSEGQIVNLKYDSRGRIAEITDQSKKVVTIKYEERFGKPSMVTRPGLGSINVTYKNDGSINDVKSNEGPSVAAQVASVFNNLLEIISPATSELSI